MPSFAKATVVFSRVAEYVLQQSDAVGCPSGVVSLLTCECEIVGSISFQKSYSNSFLRLTVTAIISW